MPGSGRYPANILSSGTSAGRAPSSATAMRLRGPGRPPQIERRWVFDAALFGRNLIDEPGRVAVILEPGAPSRFRLVGVHRKGLVVASAGMRHVIDTAPERPAAPGIDDIQGERRVDIKGRMQGGRQLPGFEPHAGDELARPPG